MTLFKLPRGHGYVFDAWVQGPCEKTTFTSFWRWKGRTRNVWLSVENTWDVLYYRHNAELWWKELSNPCRSMAEIDQSVIWWGWNYSIDYDRRDTVPRVWMHVKEVT